MASGDTLLTLLPMDGEPPSSNYATLDLRNSHPVLDFDDTVAETVVFSAIMPRAYAGGGVTVYIHYSATTDVANDVDWDVAFERIGDQQQDVDSDGFAAVQSVVNTVVPASSGLVDIVSVAFTDGGQMDSIAVGELFRVKVTRNIADTVVGDIELHAVEIKET